MHINHLHDWNISASEAIALQKQMVSQIDYHHPIDLKAKAGGERSMSEKRGTLEDAEGAVLQDPRDMAKAALPESQSPAVEDAHPLLQRLERSATRGGSFAFRDRPPPTGGAMKNDFIEGDEWDA